LARYWRQDISESGEAFTPPTDTLEGLQPMRRDPWEIVMRSQDTTCTIGRRVLAESGVGPVSDGQWRFDTGQPSSGAELDFHRCNVRLTPGSMLQVSVLYLPSGGVDGTPNNPDGAMGRLRLQLTWTADDATTETQDYDIALPNSTNDNFDELSGAGAAWGELRELSLVIIPPVDLTDDAEGNRWTISPQVECHTVYMGGARVVDFCIFERPYQAVMESDDTEWCSHVFATGDMEAASGAASQRPRERRSETSPDGNPRGGTRLTMDVAREQRLRMAPMLCTWGAYQEDNATHNTDYTPPSVTGSSSNLVCLFDSTLTSYDATREGLSVACGGYARDYIRNNGHILGTEDAAAAVPVLLRVYADSTAAVELRLMTSADSWVSVDLTTTEGWHEGWGYLRVGLNPSDPTVAQVFVNGSATVDVWAIQAMVWPSS
jgi:hypothetical protein